MKWLQASAVVAFAIALYVGTFLGSASWDGTVYVTDGMYKSDDTMRTPAAIRRVLDVSNLEGAALTQALPSRILNDIKVVQSKDGVGVELGHFVTRDEAGEKVFACRFYNRVELRFVADGVVEDGERPTMTVDGPCNYRENINRIDPIFIPVAQILAERPGSLDLTVGETEPVTLSFRHMGGVWPKNWSLYGIRMFDQERKDHEVVIDETEMRRQFSRLLPITF